MSNPISPELQTGTVGELLVQIRLLQYGVQAAPPLKDSGNDLVALKGEVIRTIQVKTTSTDNLPPWPNPLRIYRLVAIVRLSGEGNDLRLDATDIFLISKASLSTLERTWEAVEQNRMSQQNIDNLFHDP